MPLDDEDSRKIMKNVVEKSLPNRHRPRLPEHIEEELSDIDNSSAVCYANMELTTQRLLDLKTELDSSDGIPIGDLEGDTSTVNHIEELMAVLAHPPKVA